MDDAKGNHGNENVPEYAFVILSSNIKDTNGSIEVKNRETAYIQKNAT